MFGVDAVIPVFALFLCRVNESPRAASLRVAGVNRRDKSCRFEAACYTALMYLVSWSDGDAARLAVDDRPPYLELGSL